MIKWDYSRDARKFEIYKSVSMIHYINEMKNKNYMTFSTHQGKHFAKYNIYFWQKLLTNQM